MFFYLWKECSPLILNIMKKKKRHITLLLFLLLFPVILYGQSYYETTILATDKDIYQAGDTIYVTGMVCAPHLFVPSELGHYCYIELSQEDGTLVERQKVRNIGSAFYCRFPVGQLPASHCLVIRAYTRFMRNFPSYTWGKTVVGVRTGNRYPIFSSQLQDSIKVLSGRVGIKWSLSADTLQTGEPLNISVQAGRYGMQLLCRMENVRKKSSAKMLEALRTFKAQGSDACGKILFGTWKYHFVPEQVLSLQGNVKTASGKPYQKGGTVVAYSSNTGFTYDADIDEQGHFVLGVDDFKDGERFFIQAYDKKGKYKDTHIEMCTDSFPPSKASQITWKEYDGLYNGEKSSSLSDTIIWISEIDVTARTPYVENPNSRPFTNYFDEKKIRERHYIDLEQIIRAMPGLRIVETGKADGENQNGIDGKLVLSTRGSGTLNELPVVHFYIDGSWALNEDLRSMVNVTDIASIEYIPAVRAMSLYGSRAFNGVIVIKTLNGKQHTEVEPEGITYTPKGLSDNRSFPSEVPLRVCTIPADSTCTIPFQAPSYPGSYRIVLEGMENGRSFVYKELPFEVTE